MGKTTAKGSSVKYGTGTYDSQAHAGKGKAQKLLPPAAGSRWNKPTPNTGGAIVRDGVEGHGDKKRGYQTDAHSGLYHGRHGEAVGHKNDLHQEFTGPLWSEGRAPMSPDHGPGHLTSYDHANKGSKATAHGMGISTKAEHHPPASKSPHEFTKLPTREAHGYGHGPGQRNGWLRSSGHAKAHQVGRK
jgi:hypothetical protein